MAWNLPVRPLQLATRSHAETLGALSVVSLLSDVLPLSGILPWAFLASECSLVPLL